MTSATQPPMSATSSTNYTTSRGDRTPRANTRDRIAATRILLDRGFGKVPRRADYNPDRHQTPVPDHDRPVEPSHNPTPTTPGTVAQLDESLHDSLGPAPSFEPDPTSSFEPDPAPSFETDTQSTTDSHIVDVIDTQDYILMVTDNGHTLVTVLTDILRADDDDPAVRPCHQIAVARILLDRTLGSDCEPPKDSAPSRGCSVHPGVAGRRIPPAQRDHP